MPAFVYDGDQVKVSPISVSQCRIRPCVSFPVSALHLSIAREQRNRNLYVHVDGVSLTSRGPTLLFFSSID